MAQPAARSPPHSPLVLYFDPDPATARLAVGGLRLAGYQVYPVADAIEAAAAGQRFGPSGSGSLAAIVIDVTEAPELAREVLHALIEVPGLDELPGVQLVNRADPPPIPGTEGFVTVRRPFTTPALVKALREARRSDHGDRASQTPLRRELLARLEILLVQHFGSLGPSRDLRPFATALIQEAELPTPGVGATLVCDLGALRLENVLRLLESDNLQGVLQLDRGMTQLRLHIDRGTLRMADVSLSDGERGLGRFLIASGAFSAESWQTELDREDPWGRLPVQRLYEDGTVAADALAHALAQQVRETAFDAMRWTEGRAMFFPTEGLHPVLQALLPRPEASITNVILEGLRRREEYSELHPHLGAADDVFVRHHAAIAHLGRHAFSRDELVVLELLDGHNTIRDIAERTQTGNHAVGKVLFRLLAAGLAQPRHPPVVS